MSTKPLPASAPSLTGAAVPDPSQTLLNIAVEVVQKALRGVPVEPLLSGAHVATPDAVPLARVSVTSVRPDFRTGVLGGEVRVIVYGDPDDATYGMALAAVPERIWGSVTERGNRHRLRSQKLSSGEVRSGELRTAVSASFAGLVTRTYILMLDGISPSQPIVAGEVPALAAKSLAATVAGTLADLGEAVEVSAGRITTTASESAGLRTCTAVVAVQPKVQPGGRWGIPYGSGSGNGPGAPLSEKVERALPGTFVPAVGRVEGATAQGFHDGALRVAVTVKAALAE